MQNPFFIHTPGAPQSVPAKRLTPKPPIDDTPPNMHREILIVPKFLSPEICAEYVTYCKSQKEEDLSVFDPVRTNETGEVSWEIDKETRNTQTVPTAPIREVLEELMHTIVREQINPFFNVQVKDSEMPQLLIYHPGGHYQAHIDAEAAFDDGSGQLQWKRNVDRDISIVLYFNDEFEGGELGFPRQAITVRPRTGMLVAFPSSHHFLHVVYPITKGTRYALVNWFSLGTPTD